MSGYDKDKIHNEVIVNVGEDAAETVKAFMAGFASGVGASFREDTSYGHLEYGILVDCGGAGLGCPGKHGKFTRWIVQSPWVEVKE